MERKRPQNRLMGETNFDIEKKEEKVSLPERRSKKNRRSNRRANRSSGDDASSNSNMSTDVTMPNSSRRGSTEKADVKNVSVKNQNSAQSSNGSSKAINMDAVPEPSDVAGLESAAFSSRLAYDKMTPLEAEHFPDLQSPQVMLKSYLYIRNKILLLWIENSNHQLLFENTLPHIESPFDQNVKLIRRIFNFLERQSLINFGSFKISRPLQPFKMNRSVIVLGAGMAGLGAARQLQYFGLDVTLVEARDRVGGRIHTYRNEKYVTDLGAMVIMGLGGNPINIINRQVYMDLVKVRPKCPLYDNAGNVVPRHKDDFVEREWNKLLEATVCLFFLPNCQQT